MYSFMFSSLAEYTGGAGVGVPHGGWGLEQIFFVIDIINWLL